MQGTSREIAWEGSRDFRVPVRVFEEPALTQCSFVLTPVEGAPLPPFKPGQFLTFSLPVAGPKVPGRVIRCYSISDRPEPDHYRMTVKRAVAPPNRPDAAPGISSDWLHDHAQAGTILQVRTSSGQFFFAANSGAPPVFIAGGIGITAMLSMLKAALEQRPEQPAHLFYGRGGSSRCCGCMNAWQGRDRC